MPRKRKSEAVESKPRKRKEPEPIAAPEPISEAELIPVAEPAPAEPVGLRCRRCNCGHFFTIRVTPTSQNRIMRRRECRHCGLRVTTIERQIGV